MRPKLAISLNASNDDLRTRLMPINRKWNLEKLMAAARDFPLRNREKLTFEYVLLDEVNDSAENARELVELIRGVRAKVNLIALNPGPGNRFPNPGPKASSAVPEYFDDRRRARVRSPSPRTRYLCRLRTTETNRGDSPRVVVVESLDPRSGAPICSSDWVF